MRLDAAFFADRRLLHRLACQPHVDYASLPY